MTQPQQQQPQQKPYGNPSGKPAETNKGGVQFRPGQNPNDPSKKSPEHSGDDREEKENSNR